MEAVQWKYRWPGEGETFSSKSIVTESQYLYGNVLGTMERVGREGYRHEVLFAGGPGIWRGGKVVHRVCIWIRRKAGV